MPELLPYAPGSPEWLAARRTGVTATDIVTILGLSSWNSPYSLFWQKMGQVPEPADNDRWRLGRFNEPYVVERWAEEHRDYACYSGHLYRHSDRPWQIATLDRLVVQDADRAQMPLECKTWADADKPAWSDGPPAAVRTQVLWQMDIMDVAAGHVGVVFLPSGEFRSYVIEHDPNCKIQMAPADCPACLDLALMREAGLEFMARLRLELPAPDPDASAASLAAVRARFAKTPDKQAEVTGSLYADWCDAKDSVAEWKAIARGYETGLREQAGEASVLTVDGLPVARRIVGDSPVKAHIRHSDYLRRIAPKETDSE